jgi:hypothetical protein
VRFLRSTSFLVLRANGETKQHGLYLNLDVDVDGHCDVDGDGQRYDSLQCVSRRRFSFPDHAPDANDADYLRRRATATYTSNSQIVTWYATTPSTTLATISTGSVEAVGDCAFSSSAAFFPVLLRCTSASS